MMRGVGGVRRSIDQSCLAKGLGLICGGFKGVQEEIPREEAIDTLTQEDFHGAFEKLLERYNKCIATGGDYFEGD